MTRVKCRRRDCAFWDEGICSRDLITVDEDGCRNFEEIIDFLEDEELEWEEEEEEVEYLDEEEEEGEEDEEEPWEEDEGEEDESDSGGYYRNRWGI